MQIISAIIPFVLLPYLLRYFGKETYGILVLAFSIYTFMFILNNAINLILMKYVSEVYELKDFRRLNAIINDFWIAAFFNSLVVSLILIFIGTYGLRWLNISNDILLLAKRVFYIIGIMGIIDSCFNVFGGVLMGLQKIHENNLFNLMGAILRIVAVILVLVFNKSLVTYIFFLTVIPILVGILRLIYLKTILPQMTINFRKHFDWKELKKMRGFSGYQILNQISDILMYNSDKLIIQKVLGSVSIVMYEVANKPNLFFQSFISLPLSAILPACSAAYARGDKEFLNKMLIKGTRIYLTLTLPVIFAFIICMKPFLELWVGKEYLSVAICAQLFLATYMVACPFKVFSHMMVGKARVFEYGLTKFVYAIINIPLSIYFVFKFGIIGGIIVTVLYYYIVYWSTNVYVMIKEGYSIPQFVRSLVPSFLILVPEYIVIKLLSGIIAGKFFDFFLSFGMGVGIYLLIAYLFLFSSKERKLLNFKSIVIKQ